MKIMLFAGYAAELIALISASFYFYKYKKTPLKYFLFYLWYVVLNEIAAHHLLQNGIIKFQLTNIYGFITTIFTLWMCNRYLTSYGKKRITNVIIVIALLISLWELLTKGINKPWVLTKTIGPLLALVAFLFYLIDLFNIKSVVNPFKELFTYFLLGFTLFFVASPVILIARIYFQDNTSMSLNLTYILAAIVILMYLIFSFGFIWSKKIE